MGNTNTAHNIYVSIDGLFSDKSDLIGLTAKKSDKAKLLSTVRYIDNSNNGNVIINEELADKQVYEIACHLAAAIDKNSPVEVKRIKYECGETPEFAKAKEFLNKKCKQIWDVFENKNTQMNIPKEAMKALGITNKPSLESLLDDSIKFYEKDNGTITTDLISLILENKNLDYTFDEIFEYLKIKYSKEHCRYNFITVKYIAEKLNYDMEKISLLCMDIDLLKKIFNSLSVKEKIKYVMKNCSYII